MKSIDNNPMPINLMLINVKEVRAAISSAVLFAALLALSSCANIGSTGNSSVDRPSVTKSAKLTPANTQISNSVTYQAPPLAQHPLNWSKVETTANSYYHEYYQAHPEVSENFTEESLKDDFVVKSFAKDTGTSLVEARRRLIIQSEINGLYSALEQELGEALISGTYTGDTSEYRLELNTLKTVAPGRYLYQFLEGPAKGSHIIVVIRSNSDVTMVELNKLREAGDKKLKARYPNAHYTSGYQFGEYKIVVTFYGTELTEQERLEREAELTELFGFPVMVEAYSSYLVDL